MHSFVENHLYIVKFAPYIFFVSIAIFLAIGWLYGRYRLRKSESIIVRESLATAIFGLSALVLGFTFSSATDHFDTSINIIRNQAETLTQVYRSSNYLAPADAELVKKSLKTILADRLAVYENLKSIDELNEHLDVLSQQLSELNSQITISIPRAPTNTRELADKVLRSQQERLMSVFHDGILNAKHHPPVIIERFLFVLLSIGALLSGYAMAVQKEEDWFLTVMYLGLIGLALLVIFSLEFPNQLIEHQMFNSDLLRVQKLIR